MDSSFPKSLPEMCTIHLDMTLLCETGINMNMNVFSNNLVVEIRLLNYF